MSNTNLGITIKEFLNLIDEIHELREEAKRNKNKCCKCKNCPGAKKNKNKIINVELTDNPYETLDELSHILSLKFKSKL